MLYIAPYAGTAMGEEVDIKGRDILVYDDLSKTKLRHIWNLPITSPSPGREAYPGCILLTSRLLERAAKLSDELGQGHYS